MWFAGAKQEWEQSFVWRWELEHKHSHGPGADMVTNNEKRGEDENDLAPN